MQAIVKTNYGGKEESQVVGTVISLAEVNSIVSIVYTDENGDKKVQFIRLDGYTEILLR